MKVELLHHTPLWVCSEAIRTCWDSGDKSDTAFLRENLEYGEFIGYIQVDRNEGYDEVIMGEKDEAIIDRVGNKYKHASTLEHLVYNFHISGVSRALLQELARHRMASLSVKSTRYTLKELKDEMGFTLADKKRASKYLVMTDVDIVNEMSIIGLENLRKVLVEGISNDKAKYCLPESYKTELTYTVNARSLQNFLSLRSDKAALWEIRDLANAIFDALPDEHKYLFEHCVKEQ